MPAANAFNPNAGLSLRLPRCPAPRCLICKAELRDVRPFRTEQPNGALTLVQCLAKCGKCGTKHSGTRRIQSTPQGSRFLGQTFALWTDSDERTLRPVADSLAQAAANDGANAAPSALPPVEVVPIKAGARAAVSPSLHRRRRAWLVRGTLLVSALIAAAAAIYAGG
jgi:hypothetical protein